MKKNILISSLAIVGVAGASIWGFGQLDNNSNRVITEDEKVTQVASSAPQHIAGAPVDFTAASETSVLSVVHITTKKEVNALTFYGYQTVPQTGSGSGVIISNDGYIVTNNHVVDGADEVKVTFSNNKSTIAKVIGVDPSTDLAVLKVEGTNHPHLVFGNSDDVVLGQWVLAVGYPFNLDVTVTAGIVSAKSRNLGINNRQSKYSIESFIQTDAAVNMGNSGGALVNTSGHLIGINSAIATPTGAYAGYSYAIPSNLVRKVVEDLIKYGQVQRGFVGASFVDINLVDEKTAHKFGVTSEDYHNAAGVLVTDIVSNSGAHDAGIQAGDIITQIDDITLKNSSQMMEIIAQKNPGDQIQLAYIRNGSLQKSMVLLKDKNKMNNMMLSQKNRTQSSQRVLDDHSNNHDDSYTKSDLGLELSEITEEFREKYGINNGVLINSVSSHSTLRQFTNIKDGFLITKINGKQVNTADEVYALLSDSKSIKIEGTYPGTNSYQSYSFRSYGR